MISLMLEIVMAVIASYFAYLFKWWLASIVFPLIISFSNKIYHQDKPMVLTRHRSIIDMALTIMSIGYGISQIIIFQMNIGHWYGWIVGIFVGWIGMTFMAPRRWAHESN